MPTPVRHSIQRQTVWLDTPGQPPSFGLQDRVSAYCRNQLPAVLETLFDRLSNADTTLRIDQLTIDAGNLSLAKLEDELTQRITQQVELAFQQVVEQAETTPANSIGVDAGLITGPIERVSRQERMAQQIRYFLLYGRLPIWADTRDFGQLDQWLTTASAASFRRELVELLYNRPELASRLIHHSTNQALVSLAFDTDNHSTETSHEALSIAIGLLLIATQELSQLPVQILRERYWQGFLTATAAKKSLTSSLITFQKTLFPSESPSLFFGRLRQIIEHRFGKDESTSVDLLLQTLTKLIETSTTTGPFSNNTIQRNEKKGPKSKPDQSDPPALSTDQLSEKTASEDPDLTDSPSGLPPVSENQLTSHQASTLPAKAGHSSNQTSRNQAPGEAALFVSLAGIVLLHPFLTPLFSEMGLVVNRQWTDETAATKGAQMLAYLATGLDYCPEYEMTLPKLLCGVPFDALVSPHLDLTGTDRLNATELLHAVIGHWPALGTVSADGLREAFLQREGKLTRSDAGWQLTVERKTIDILMNKFPWGFSAIKLPFMPDLLLVDWAY
ncbi:contractile injection system tape measure protein [Spirosoma pollinicola]|uniref:Uncharacterized protein n=1 Tax=Spirosoma pollinicola TaxID=2057025 RepID=A0A2K8Z4U4_9BACT|nr:contractile injection system tape measure protein [Spirosoma pollinicola]AUD04881.1 hypothetical protein CWM47_25375 [Spirosoma pollinicola]